MQPQCHAWNPCQDGYNDPKGHCRGPKGPGLKASRSGVCDVQQPSPFQAQNNVFRYTTEELLSITAQYANGKEAADPLPISGGREVALCSSKAMPSNVVIPDAMGDTKR
jgi:hypothetical protein